MMAWTEPMGVVILALRSTKTPTLSKGLPPRLADEEGAEGRGGEAGRQNDQRQVGGALADRRWWERAGPPSAVPSEQQLGPALQERGEGRSAEYVRETCMRAW